MRISDWSSDVCSSDLLDQEPNSLSRLSLNGLLSMALFIGSVMLGMKRVGPAHVARLPLTKRRELMKAAAVAINDDWPKGLHEVFGLFISSEPLDRSEERRVGKECDSTCRSRGSA